MARTGVHGRRLQRHVRKSIGSGERELHSRRYLHALRAVRRAADAAGCCIDWTWRAASEPIN